MRAGATLVESILPAAITEASRTFASLSWKRAESGASARPCSIRPRAQAAFARTPGVASRNARSRASAVRADFTNPRPSAETSRKGADGDPRRAIKPLTALSFRYRPRSRTDNSLTRASSEPSDSSRNSISATGGSPDSCSTRDEANLASGVDGASLQSPHPYPSTDCEASEQISRGPVSAVRGCGVLTGFGRWLAAVASTATGRAFASTVSAF